MSIRRFMLALCGLALAVAAGRARAAETATPPPPPPMDNEYGVNIHAMWEYREIPREYEMLNKAGVRFVRSDFSWRDLERREGEWNFERHDLALATAEKNGLTLLPIIGYAPEWATPAHKNMDEWLAAVEKIIDRYGAKMKYWEIWNEHNYAVFWKDPDPKDYLPLLKATAELIRRKAPGSLVVLGGTSQIPLPYIETLLKDGAAEYFDVMNVHPYNWYDIPEVELEKQIADLRALMRKYNAEKPIWVTEIGWPTDGPKGYFREFLPGALKAAGIDVDDFAFAAVKDRALPLTMASPGYNWAEILPGAKRSRDVTLDEIAALDPAEWPVLFPAPTEAFSTEARHVDGLVEYVKKGGLAVFPRGVPFYTGLRQDKDGVWAKSWIDQELRARLHIAFDAWWLDKERRDFPRNFTLAIPKEYEKDFAFASPPGSNAVLTAAACGPEDRMIPLLGVKEGNQGALAAYYKLGGDFKGGVIATTFNWVKMAAASEELQGKLVPRTILTLFKAGVDKMNWYEFQAMETNPNDPEHYFGLVHKDLEPKPGWIAFQALAKFRPAGSTRPVFRTLEGGLRLASWRKPGGGAGHALWTTGAAVDARLRLTGDLRQAADHLGAPLAVKAENGHIECAISDGIIYLDGPEDVERAD